MSETQNSASGDLSKAQKLKIKFKNGIIPHYGEGFDVEYKAETDKWNCFNWTYTILMVFLTFIVACIAYGNDSFNENHVGEGTVSIRVNGAVDTSNVADAELNMSNAEYYKRVWTPQDLVYPPTQRHIHNFAILTNIFIIPNQTIGYCPGVNSPALACKLNSECNQSNIIQRNDAGVLTGRCISAEDPHNSTKKRCEMHGYCPPYVPFDHPFPFNKTKSLLEDVGNNTFFVIKSSIEFPSVSIGQFFWNVPRRDTINACFYDPKTQVNCPKFRPEDIVKWAGYDFKNISIEGGIFRINVLFECDFPMDLSLFSLKLGKPAACSTKYTFKRVVEHPLLAPGWYYDCSIQVEQKRRLFRECYGIKILVDVDGIGRQLTLKRIFIDTILSSATYIFLPGLFIKYVVRCCFAPNHYYGENTTIKKHPDVGMKICLCRFNCYTASETETEMNPNNANQQMQTPLLKAQEDATNDGSSEASSAV